MLKEEVTPTQVFKVGVTVILAVTGVEEVLMAVNADILPVPVSGNPMEALLLVQMIVEFISEPVNKIGVIANPLHTTCVAGCVMVGLGFTVTATVNGEDVIPQMALIGVTVYVAVCWVMVGLLNTPLMVAVPTAFETPPVNPPVTAGADHT